VDLTLCGFLGPCISAAAAAVAADFVFKLFESDVTLHIHFQWSVKRLEILNQVYNKVVVYCTLQMTLK
jgi:hypothetical protein